MEKIIEKISENEQVAAVNLDLPYYVLLSEDEEATVESYANKIQQGNDDEIIKILDTLNAQVDAEMEFFRLNYSSIINDIKDDFRQTLSWCKSQKYYNAKLEMSLLIGLKKERELKKILHLFEKLHQEAVLRFSAIRLCVERKKDDNLDPSLIEKYVQLIEKIEENREEAELLIQNNRELISTAQFHTKKAVDYCDGMCDSGKDRAKNLMPMLKFCDNMDNSHLKSVNDICSYHENGAMKMATIIATEELKIKRYGSNKKDVCAKLIEEMNALARKYFNEPSRNWDVEQLKIDIDKYVKLTGECLYTCSNYIDEKMKNNLLTALYKLHYNLFLINGYSVASNYKQHMYFENDINLEKKTYMDLSSAMMNSLIRECGIDKNVKLYLTFSSHLLKLHNLYCGEIPDNSFYFDERIFSRKLPNSSLDKPKARLYFPFLPTDIKLSIEQIYLLSKLFKTRNDAFDDINKNQESFINIAKLKLICQNINILEPNIRSCGCGLEYDVRDDMKEEIDTLCLDKIMFEASWRKLCEYEQSIGSSILAIPSILNLRVIEKVSSVNLIKRYLETSSTKAIYVTDDEQLEYVCKTVRGMNDISIIVPNCIYEGYCRKLRYSKSFRIIAVPDGTKYIELAKCLEEELVFEKV